MNSADLKKLSQPRWLRQAMYFIILAMSASSLIQLIFVHHAENLRKSDITLLSLTANQATLSQRAIRFAMAFQRDSSEAELRAVINEIMAQSNQLDILIAEEFQKPSPDLAKKYQNLQISLGLWRIDHNMLITDGVKLLKLMEAGNMEPAGIISSNFQVTAISNIASANKLYADIDDLLNTRNKDALASINKWIKINLLAIFVSLILVEPILALIKRQYKRLIEQAHELEIIASEREKNAAAALVEAETTSRLALEEKVMFIAIGSHDLRTPLQTILSTIDFMLIRVRTNGFQGAELEDNLSKLEIACKHIEGIARDLGEFVRDSEGYEKETKKVISLSQCLLNNYDTYYEAAESKGLNIQLEEKHSCDFIQIEENMLSRILSNLTSNAIKYTKSGSITLSTASPSSGEIEIKISDTGIGIEPELIKSISKPFFRTAGGRIAHHEGLGLGLSIVERFIKFMKGRLEITSTPGKGSVFRIILPVETSTSREMLATKTSMHTEFVNFPVKVVYVDDDSRLVSELTQITQALGDQVHVKGFTNTDEALRYMETHAVDCIFTDLQMNPVDGYELTRNLKELQLSQVPLIVAMSAYNIRMEHQALFDMFVTKPISSRTIAEILNDLNTSEK